MSTADLPGRGREDSQHLGDRRAAPPPAEPAGVPSPRSARLLPALLPVHLVSIIQAIYPEQQNLLHFRHAAHAGSSVDLPQVPVPDLVPGLRGASATTQPLSPAPPGAGGRSQGRHALPTPKAKNLLHRGAPGGSREASPSPQLCAPPPECSTEAAEARTASGHSIRPAAPRFEISQPAGMVTQRSPSARNCACAPQSPRHCACAPSPCGQRYPERMCKVQTSKISGIASGHLSNIDGNWPNLAKHLQRLESLQWKRES